MQSYNTYTFGEFLRNQGIDFSPLVISMSPIEVILMNLTSPPRVIRRRPKPRLTDRVSFSLPIPLIKKLQEVADLDYSGNVSWAASEKLGEALGLPVTEEGRVAEKA